MADDGLLKLAGAPEPTPDKYVSLATVKFIAGLQTQRSPFASIDTRYNSKFLGGKPDALNAGYNCEVSNELTLQRRPGLVPYGVSNIPSPDYFFDWELATTGDILLVVDTASGGGDNFVGSHGGVLNYSPTHSGVYLNKSAGSSQTNFTTVANTLYFSDGVDQYKITGPNLLYWSNQFGTGAGTIFTVQAPWTENDIFSLTGGQTDPLGGTNATQIVWSTTGSAVYLKQSVTPNYTPAAYNTFTFSIWMEYVSGAESVDITIGDQNGAITTQTVVLTSSWARYQVTATLKQNSTAVVVSIQNPNSTHSINLYGAQLEVGGPATTAQITTVKPQGVWLWGITAPTAAPTLSYANKTGNTGKPWQPNTAYNVGDTIVDTNGNLQYATNGGVYPGTVGDPAGTSGNSAPTWNVQVGGLTLDSIQSILIQSVTSTASSVGSANTASVTFPVNVTAGNALLVAVLVSHPQVISISDNVSDTFVSTLSNGNGGHQAPSSGDSRYNSISAGQFTMYMFYVSSAVGGATTISVSGGGNTGTYIAAAELGDVSSQDGSIANSNFAQSTAATYFNTGGVTTVNATDLIVSVGAFLVSNSAGAGAEIGAPPTGDTVLTTDAGVAFASNTALFNMTMALTAVTSAGYYNPNWTITNPTVKSQIVGITVPFKTNTGTLQWYNLGPSGLTTAIGYQYYFSYGNSYTGHFSNVSPISGSTGVITGQIVSVTGKTRTMTTSGGYSDDPQSDLVAVYRNTDGGGFWFQCALFGNGAAAQAALVAANYTGLTTSGVSYGSGTWTFQDTVTDADLNTSIYAPIALLNSIPPTGMKDMDFFAQRMWGSINNLVYFNTSADNAAALGITQNGVPAESWYPLNYVSCNTQAVRILGVSNGLLVFTVTDIWFVTGSNLTNGGFDPQKAFVGHGLRSYNALSVDGTSIYVYTSDRQFLVLNPNSGSVEMGYAIGDTLEMTYDPTTVYISRHVAGSRDNAVFIANDNSWYRLNPNQQGASMSGEQTPVFSPEAQFSSTIGGLGAIASIETSAGNHYLLVGLPEYSTSGIQVAGPVLRRDLDTFTDNGTEYTWSGTIGSILLTTPGKLAEAESITTEMNNSANNATQVGVAVLLEEISGTFEELPNSVYDPPQLIAASQTVLSQRFYLSQGTVPPICRHLQIQVNGGLAATKDEILAITVRGALVPEQV